MVPAPYSVLFCHSAKNFCKLYFFSIIDAQYVVHLSKSYRPNAEDDIGLARDFRSTSKHLVAIPHFVAIEFTAR